LRRKNANGEASPKMTFGEAAAVHLRNLDDNSRIKPRTRDYWREGSRRSSQKLARLKRDRGSQDHANRLQKWAIACAKEASASRYNGSPACPKRRNLFAGDFFQFEKRCQLFMRTCNETLSVVTMCVRNEDCSPGTIHEQR
jgi:hypothetical protein